MLKKKIIRQGHQEKSSILPLYGIQIGILDPRSVHLRKQQNYYLHSHWGDYVVQIQLSLWCEMACQFYFP